MSKIIKVLAAIVATAGFQVSAQSLSTVAGVKSQPVADQKVILQGGVVTQLSHETYLFKDQTGNIQVEIDIDEWPEQQPLANQLVQITGEIEVEANGPIIIDVEHVQLIDLDEKRTI